MCKLNLVLQGLAHDDVPGFQAVPRDLVAIVENDVVKVEVKQNIVDLGVELSGISVVARCASDFEGGDLRANILD